MASKTAKQQKSIEFETELVLSSSGSGWHFLIMSGDVATQLGFEGKFRRVVCTLNGTESFQCAMLPWGELFYIIVNKKKRDALALPAGDTVHVRLVSDQSLYARPISDG